MMRRIARRRISASPEDVMAVLCDTSRWPQWRPGLTGITNLSDPAIVLAAAWHEERTLAYAATGHGIDVLFRWTTRAEDGRTQLAQETAIRATGLRHFFAGTAKRFLEEQHAAPDALRDLKQAPHPLNPPARP